MDAKLRAWWWHRQGLDGRINGAQPASVLERSGWARSVGGVGPYLTLFSRAGASREAVDAAVTALQIHELPAARGCTYVVPASDFALALQCGGDDDSEMATARKLGVTDKEVDRLRQAVVDALGKGPLLPDELRDATGGTARNLGPEGAKKGLTSTLPLALGRLQSEGEIRRVATNGRLDQQRYRYARWAPNPLACGRLPREQVHVELARRYFRWIGPATVNEFRWFSGLGAKLAQAAIAELKLVPLRADDERLMFPDDLDAFGAFVPPRAAQYSLVSSLDGISHLRRDVKSLVEANDRRRVAPGAKNSAELGGLSDFPSHAIFDRGRLVGLWEYDPEAEQIAWWSMIPADKALTSAVERTEQFVRGQLGDARSFSLDSPKSRAPRIAELRKAARHRA